MFTPEDRNKYFQTKSIVSKNNMRKIHLREQLEALEKGIIVNKSKQIYAFNGEKLGILQYCTANGQDFITNANITAFMRDKVKSFPNYDYNKSFYFVPSFFDRCRMFGKEYFILTPELEYCLIAVKKQLLIYTNQKEIRKDTYKLINEIFDTGGDAIADGLETIQEGGKYYSTLKQVQRYLGVKRYIGSCDFAKYGIQAVRIGNGKGFEINTLCNTLLYRKKHGLL